MVARDLELLGELVCALSQAVTAAEQLFALADVCAFDEQPFQDGRCPLGHTRDESDAYEAHCAAEAHDCPREQFLEDPITRASGVGSEMVGLVSCAVCESREAGVS